MTYFLTVTGMRERPCHVFLPGKAKILFVSKIPKRLFYHKSPSSNIHFEGSFGFCSAFSERTWIKNKLVRFPLQITVLQLSALLKQADSSKRKLTLTRLASAPVPFTVLSLTGNPCKEDYLAVCGLKVKTLI